MHAALALAQLGGTARTEQLLRSTTSKKLRSAVRKGVVVALGKGAYALPGTDEARAAAIRLSGVLTHLSAAREWGWEVARPPAAPQVTVPRKRKVAPERRADVQVFWRDLDPSHHNGKVTSRLWTALDCARDLPFEEALAVVDSALREGQVEREDLAALASRLAAPTRRRAMRVIDAGDERSWNPFESMLRAYALEAGLDVVPQQEVRSHGLVCHPDLVDAGRRLVLEAEGFESHGHRKALRQDCRRYTLLALGGWRVARFSWEDVMFQQSYVRAALGVLAREGRSDRQSRARGRRTAG